MHSFRRFMIREEDGGDNQGTAGDQSPDEQPPVDDPPAQPEPSQLEKELAKLREEKRKLEQERNTYKEGLKAKELEQMKAQERYKEIAELKEREAEESKQEVEKMKTTIERREKMNALRSAALIAGMRKEALDDLEYFDFPEVQIEISSLGNYSVTGAKEAVESLKMRKPYLFGKKSSGLNGSLPDVVEGGKITIDQILAADAKARKSGSAEDRAAYLRLSKQYQQQQRGN